ncbi:MAG: FAD-dependent monooxygenase [Burkholderiales bacterium]|nr:FAD-dependent monooxygenase [Burkholderiales bacterium]
MKVMIVGGGIAGLVSAIALHKARIPATVYEAADYGHEGVGAYLTVAVNGLHALKAIDVDIASLGGFETPRMALSLGSGLRLAEFDYGPVTADGVRSLTIRRATLYASLRDEALRRGIQIEYGKRLRYAQRVTGGQVRATFADGSEAVGDVLIGADGLGSRVRALIDAQAPRPRYVGLLNTGGYARGIAVPGAPGTMQMIFGRRCFFGYIPHPNGEVLWFANPASKREQTKAELAAITPAQWRAELEALFAIDDTPALDIIRATAEIIPPWNTYDFPTVPTWHRDGMIIIGDAAHATSPSSGQGASMAIEDAVALAICLRDGADVEAAFARFETMRRERVERVVALGKKAGDGKTPGPIGRVLRDLILRWVFSRKSTRTKDDRAWIFDYRLQWERAV